MSGNLTYQEVCTLDSRRREVAVVQSMTFDFFLAMKKMDRRSEIEARKELESGEEDWRMDVPDSSNRYATNSNNMQQCGLKVYL